MEQRRFFTFIVLSMTIWVTWFHFVGPAVIPNAFPKPNKLNPGGKLGQMAKDESDLVPADALHPANEPADEKVPDVAAPPEHAVVEVQLGPDEDGKKRFDDFFLAAKLNSRGAAIDSIELTDKQRYPAFGHRGRRIKVLGSDPFTPLRTFSLQSPDVDDLVKGWSLDMVPWEYVLEPDPKIADHAATFRIVSPDRRWEITKHYELKKLTDEEQKLPDVEKELVAGYEVKLKVSIRNLTDQPQTFNYTLQGPVGTPLEDAANSYKHRDIRFGFLRDDGNVDESKLSAADTVKKEKNNQPIEWKRKLKYIGVDVLYFAALVLPNPDQIESAKAVVAQENAAKPMYSDVSVQLKSVPLTVDPKSEVTHEYRMYAGPKQKSLIAKIPAMAVMDYGWFDTICRGMIWLLNMFHSFGLSYGIAIICLTALVRTLLMPISKHQAANAAKMKVLQPKIMAKQKELEAKYGKNTEEYTRAASELSKEQLGLMMSGCLPAFLQLPIFIALYRAIGSSIELRMEPFLWFENLASPDALFTFPFTIKLPIPGIYPWPEWTHFNLLPCISTGLMFLHSKLMSPPPTNEEQAQQQKVMSYMMIFMGAMFFRVPSGLCLYFIATNVWSMTERWLFEHWKKAPSADETALATTQTPPTAAPNHKPVAPANKDADAKPSAFGSFWNRLQEAADKQVTAKRQRDNPPTNRPDKKKRKR